MRHKGHLFETIAIAAVTSCIGFVSLSLAQNAPTPTGGSAILPVPEPAFRGVIGRKASESKPDYPPAVAAPKGAPNVLLIMTDDTGFLRPAPSAVQFRRRTLSGFTSAVFAIISFTPPHSAHRRVLRFSRAATIITSATALFQSLPPAIRATTRSFPRARAPSATFFWATATTRRGLASTT